MSKQCNGLGNILFLDVAFLDSIGRNMSIIRILFCLKMYFSVSRSRNFPQTCHFPSHTWEMLQICKTKRLYFLKGKDTAIIQYEPLSLLSTAPPLETVYKVVL